MAPKTTATAPWQELEKQAYHAYREWHIWLALRERELAGRRPAGQADKRAPDAANPAERSERKTTSQEGVTE
jgi:hypothetical protein